MKTLTLLLIVLFNYSALLLNAQNVGINATGAAPNSKALLDIDADGLTKGGLLVPRMTETERNTISTPIPESLVIYNTTSQCFEAWNQTTSEWKAFGCIGGCTIPDAPTALDATNITFANFEANWTASDGAKNYFVEVSLFPDFLALLNNVYTGNSTSAIVAGLPEKKTIYYRLKASNDCGNSEYSNTISLTTNAIPSICGGQEWATANLNVGTFLTYASNNQTNNSIIEKWCFNNIPANCDVFGGLYRWQEAMNWQASINCDPCGSSGRQGICPDGYHIPTDLEWSRFDHCVYSTIEPLPSPSNISLYNLAWFQANSGSNRPGDNTLIFKLQRIGYNVSSNNNSFFGAFATGYYQNSWTGISEVIYWTATQSQSGASWLRRIASNLYFRTEQLQSQGYSVRCLKN